MRSPSRSRCHAHSTLAFSLAVFLGGCASHADGDSAAPIARPGGDGGAGGPTTGAATASGDAGDAPIPAGCDPEADPRDSPACVADALGAFVAPTGGDIDGDGTKERPFATIGRALASLTSSGKQRVYVCSAEGVVYDEALRIAGTLGGVRIYGGFGCGNWASGGAPARIAPHASGAVPLTIAEVTVPVVIEDVELVAPDGAAPGGSSVAAMVHDAIGATFVRTRFMAGRGADGATGAAGTAAAAPGARAAVGASAFYSAPLHHVVGGAATSCACADATSVGGRGGDGENASHTPMPGSDGTPARGSVTGTGAGGQAGTGVLPTLCTAGARGGDGADGTDGAGGVAGSLASTGWIGAAGASGTSGTSAQGGGGGGGTEGPNGAGAGGGAGGASLGIAMLRASVTLESCDVVAGIGGRGGNGAAGANGQLGGAGGSATGVDAVGCGGGAGGDGGSGGAGGGGAGGPSIAIAHAGCAHPPLLRATTTSHAAPGEGGAGGAGTSNAGTDGLGDTIREL